MTSKFKRQKNNGGVEALKKRVLKPGTVDVGIIDAGNHPSGDITTAGIGFIHEFGGEKIPERSFIRSTLEDKKKELNSLKKKLLKKVQNGDMDINKALGLLGEFLSSEIKNKIVGLKSPPNKPETITRKGSSNPLIDTGQLKNSITYKVDK